MKSKLSQNSQQLHFDKVVMRSELGSSNCDQNRSKSVTTHKSRCWNLKFMKILHNEKD